VLKGEMSLVGPRPERPELVAELQKQIPFYRARLLTKPGITGWAQVNFGKGASIKGSAEKLEYDLYYIKHQNLLLDLWIILRTTGSVIRFRGV
jgi:lipopolysaccharide/colanic/teichoic acid biosynthesis glycosyltransferase